MNIIKNKINKTKLIKNIVRNWLKKLLFMFCIFRLDHFEFL